MSPFLLFHSLNIFLSIGILAYANGLVCYYAAYSTDLKLLEATCYSWATSCYVGFDFYYQLIILFFL